MGQPRRSHRSPRRSFRPDLNGPLEDRTLLSTGQAEVSQVAEMLLASRRSPGHKATTAAPTGDTVHTAVIRRARVPIQTFVANGGRSVRVRDAQGEYFDVKITGVGTVTARPMPNHDGRVRIITFGTNSASSLSIDPARPRARQGQAHTFNPAFGKGDELLNVGEIQIRSGRIGQVLGFRTMNLSGPVVVLGDSNVSRIAANRLLPGALIDIAGDLDTLDVFVDANLAGPGTGIFVGRDLNWTNVRGDLTVSNGAAVSVGRDVGLVAQAAKGTGSGGQGILVQGNFTIAPESAVIINRDLAGPMTIQGNFNGYSRFVVKGSASGTISVLGTTSP